MVFSCPQRRVSIVILSLSKDPYSHANGKDGSFTRKRVPEAQDDKCKSIVASDTACTSCLLDGYTLTQEIGFLNAMKAILGRREGEDERRCSSRKQERNRCDMSRR